MRSAFRPAAAGTLRRLVAVLGLAALSLGQALPAGAQGDPSVRAERPVYQVVAGIAPGARVNLRSGPANLFPVVATLSYGDRVQRLGCQDTVGVRWCRVRAEDRANVTGWIAARFLADALPPGGGEPRYWAVRGLPLGDLLNVRARPAADGRVLATLREGEVVRNLGCQQTGRTRWCQIRSLSGVDVTGWVNASFLRESRGPRPDGGEAGGSRPDAWVVANLRPGDTLNVRARPSTQAGVLAALREGTRVRNLGCELAGGVEWCLIRTLNRPDVTGWVRSRYLRERR